MPAVGWLRGLAKIRDYEFNFENFKVSQKSSLQNLKKLKDTYTTYKTLYKRTARFRSGKTHAKSPVRTL